jgi:hypothetical protein
LQQLQLQADMRGDLQVAATLFISYAHKDEVLLDELLAHLQPLAAEGVIDIWHDRRLVAGDDIFPNIEAALDRAQVVLLLVSEAFLASHECTREMWRALASRERRRAVVVPVILQSCSWRAAPYGSFNALPTDGVPIAAAQDRTSACRDVAGGVRRLAEQLDHRSGSARLRRRWALILTAVAAGAVGILAFRDTWLPQSATARPSQIVVPEGVVAVAEFIVVAPGGAAWNPGAEGDARLPNLLLCFRQDETPVTEICQPAALGVRDGRVLAYASRTHVAERLAGMTAWSEAFSVDVGDRQGRFVRRIGRARCRFGVPCELAADDGTVVGELLVVPSEETTDARLRRYLDRCVDPQSRLARQWQAFAATAGMAEPDLGRMSQSGLVRAFLALAEVKLTPSMVDAVLAHAPAAFAALHPRDATRAVAFRAAAFSAEGDDARPLDRAEVAAALAALRGAAGATVIDDGDGCR